MYRLLKIASIISVSEGRILFKNTQLEINCLGIRAGVQDKKEHENE